MRKANGAFKAATAAAAVALMVIAGCGSSADSGDKSTSEQPTTTSGSEAPADPVDDKKTDGEGKTLNVWLQGDTVEGINLEQLNQEFEESTGAKVNFVQQTWGEYATKVTTGLADTSDAAPDVIELGNSQVAEFAAAGALLELNKADFENSDTWLEGLETSGTYDGVLYGVPYYAGVRIGIMRSDLAEAAGVTPPYESLDEYQAAAVKLMEENANGSDIYSGVRLPSRYWYAGMSFIWDHGGDIATGSDADGWTATLSSAESKAGLQRLKEFYDAVSRNSGGLDEGDDADIMGQELAASVIDAGWVEGVIVAEEDGNPDLKGKFVTFPVPSHKAGEIMPQFLGGSDIVINGNTSKADLAKAYVKLLTGQKYQEILVSNGFIPNTTSIKPADPNSSVGVQVSAASSGKFVPNSKNWTAVENANVLPDMFDAVLDKGVSIDDATAAADEKINELLNK